MENQRFDNQKKLLSLKQASEILNITVETLLEWNEHNILKPTITQTREIGYTQEQIDQLLTIRQLIQGNQSASEKTETTAQSQTWQNETKSVQADEFIDESPQSYQAKPIIAKSVKFPSTGLILSFTGMLALLTIIAAFAIQGGFNPIIYQLSQNFQKGTGSNKNVLGSQTNPVPTMRLDNESGSSVNLNNEGESVLKEKIAPSSSIYTASAQKETIVSSQSSQMTVLASNQEPPGEKTIRPSSDIANYNTAMSDTSDFNSQSNGNTSDNSTIDDNGNIRGDAFKTDTLTTILGGIGEDNSLKQVNSSKNQLIILSIFMFAVIFVFKNQLAYAIKQPQTEKIETYNNQVTTASQKVFEVDQKTDGTVVLYFQGEEHKISKPELYSDSDQFIGRLMELVQPNMKEIEYNSLNDQKVKLTTPLSRLVTRLGFVGIKRELFFPRTSKDRVFFRKYVTLQDLSAMNLTSSQVFADFISAS